MINIMLEKWQSKNRQSSILSKRGLKKNSLENDKTTEGRREEGSTKGKIYLKNVKGSI